MRHLKVNLGLSALLVLVASAGCAKSSPTSTGGAGGAGSKASGPTVSAPFDVRAVMQKVQSRFSDDGAGFSVGRASYVARVAPTGEAEFTPRVIEAGQDSDEPQIRGDTAVAAPARVGAPARISTVEILRGASTLAAAGAPLRGPDGSIVIPRGEILERLESTERGLEQSWTFPSRPLGRGDLTIRVAVAGLSAVGATAGGLHFQDPVSGVGVRYGTATWIDGVGRTAEVAARLDRGDVVLTVPEELVERSAYPAVLDPVVSAELRMDDDVAVWATYTAAIASNGTDFLLAWSDLPSGSNGARIVAARVNVQGAVLDPAGIILTPAGIRYWSGLGAAGNPATGRYFVSWTELRSDATILPGGGVYLADLNAHGAFISAAGATTTTTVSGTWPNLFNLGRPAASGTGFALPGMGLSPSLGVMPFRVDDVGGAQSWTSAGWIGLPPSGGGTSFLPTPNVGCKPSGDCLVSWVQLDGATYTPSVGWSGGTITVMGASWPMGGTLSPGTVVATSGATEPGFAIRPAVVASTDAAPFLVMWPSQDPNGVPRLWGQLVDGGLGLPTASPATPAPLPLTGDAALPRIASGVFDGTNFVVVESDRRFGTRSTAYAFRVDPATGGVLPPGELLLSNPNEGSFASAAWAVNSGVGMVQWTPLTSSMVITRFWDQPAGIVIDRPGGVPIDVVVGHSETMPRADFDGSAYLVTWIDDRAGSRLLGARVSQAGAVLDASAVILVPLATVQSQALTFNGENHVLAWVDSSDHTVKMSRITPDLALLDLGIPVGALDASMTEAGAVKVVASGRDVLVLWPVVTGGVRDLYARRMSGDGVALDPAPVLVASNIGTCTAASSGAGWFVVYSAGPYPGSGVYGFRIGADGTRSADVPLSQLPSSPYFPLVVFDGTHYRAFWTSRVTGQMSSALFAADGTRASGADLQVTGTATPHNQTAAVFDGRNALVVWTDAWGSTGNLVGTWVAGDGTLLDSATMLAPGIAAQTRGLATNGAGTVLVAYTTNDPVTRLSRTVARLVTEGASLVVSRSGSGMGRVTSTPAGVDCGTTCTAAFPAGTSVTLTAAADAGSTFAGWSGACSGTSPCTVDAGAVTQVSAKFDLAAATGSFPLSITYGGTGTGTAVPDLALGTYPVGTVVHVTAFADAGSRFSGWTGACRGTAEVCTVVVGGPVDLTAIFDLGAALPRSALPIQLLPGAGPVGGGTPVTITGSGFLPGAGVSFAGNAAPSVVVAPDGYSMTVTTPAGLVGPADVVIALPGGQVTTLPAAFTYFDASSNTPTGQDVTVVPTPPAGAPLVQMHFDDIQTAGETTITPLASAPPVPTSFFVVAAPSQPRFLEVQTQASYRGKIELTISYDPVAMGLTPDQERALRLIHFDGTRWEDATEVANPHTPPYSDSDPHYFGRNSPPFVNPDTRSLTSTHTLYGVVSSFSPIALAVGASTSVDLHVVSYGPGTGRIQGPGIDCATGAGACSASFSMDGGVQTVDLVAVPDPGMRLWSWGGACGSASTCSVPMNASRWVVAAFKPDANLLTVAPYGSGTGTITSNPAGLSCRARGGPGCTLGVSDSSATVTLTAQADPGFVFKGWSAPCLGSTASTCVVTVQAPTFVYATFAPATIPVTLNPIGDGHGTITAAGVTCTVAQQLCTVPVANTTPATPVTFQAAASSDSLFLGWGGICAGAGTNATCTVAIQGSGNVQAYFTPRTYPLTVTTPGTGAGTVSGGAIACTTGGVGTCSVDVDNRQPPTTVTLSAVASPGSTFTGWAGPCVGTGSCTVTMSGARHVIAQFDRAP